MPYFLELVEDPELCYRAQLIQADDISAACRYCFEKRHDILKNLFIDERDGKPLLKAVEFHDTYIAFIFTTVALNMDIINNLHQYIKKGRVGSIPASNDQYHLPYEQCNSINYLYDFLVWGDEYFFCLRDIYRSWHMFEVDINHQYIDWTLYRCFGSDVAVNPKYLMDCTEELEDSDMFIFNQGERTVMQWKIKNLMLNLQVVH